MWMPEDITAGIGAMPDALPPLGGAPVQSFYERHGFEYRGRCGGAT
jgi:hypothetical protein